MPLRIVDKLLLDSQYLGIGSQQEIIALEYFKDFTYYRLNCHLLIVLFEYED